MTYASAAERTTRSIKAPQPFVQGTLSAPGEHSSKFYNMISAKRNVPATPASTQMNSAWIAGGSLPPKNVSGGNNGHSTSYTSLRRVVFLIKTITTLYLSSGCWNLLCAEPHDKPRETDPLFPAQLPGSGLAQHDFLYAGESHERKIFIIRNGAVVWRYDDHAHKGEISDVVMRSNGNILFTREFGVTEITPDKRVIWNFDAAPGNEIHTAVPIGRDRVLFIENGDPAILRVINIVTGSIEKTMNLAVAHPTNIHGGIRHARLTDRGTLLVAHRDLNKVVEYDSEGGELWSFPATAPWGVSPLANGNVLITDRVGVREVTRRGDVIWTLVPADVPEYRFGSPQMAWRLPNGNTVIGCRMPDWKPSSPDAPKPPQILEFTSSKKVVWALRSWSPPADLGPPTTIQFLDNSSAEENVHFGNIH